jgi:hypothetical protein
MGGLLARAMIAQHPDVWQRLCKHPEARLIMLGTPNGGSLIVPLVLTARESLVKQLAMLDLTSDQSDLLEILRAFPGLVQMMPVVDPRAVEAGMNFFDLSTWNTLRQADDADRQWLPPDAGLLAQGMNFRKIIDTARTIDPERMC